MVSPVTRTDIPIIQVLDENDHPLALSTPEEGIKHLKIKDLLVDICQHIKSDPEATNKLIQAVEEDKKKQGSDTQYHDYLIEMLKDSPDKIISRVEKIADIEDGWVFVPRDGEPEKSIKDVLWKVGKTSLYVASKVYTVGSWVLWGVKMVQSPLFFVLRLILKFV